MLGYGDRTWCSLKCGNLECSVNFTEEDKQKAIEWWGSDHFLIATKDYRTKDCGYKEQKNDK